MARRAWATVASWAMVIGASTTWLSERLTLRTSSAWRAMGMKRWITPSPPARAMAMAISDSVTVSMLALMMGMARRRPGTRVVDRSTSARLAMRECRGTSSTSSKVRPGSLRMRIFTFSQHTD